MALWRASKRSAFSALGIEMLEQWRAVISYLTVGTIEWTMSYHRPALSG